MARPGHAGHDGAMRARGVLLGLTLLAAVPLAHADAPVITKGKLAIDPTVDPYKVKLPEKLAATGVQYWTMVKVCVTAAGAVESVKIIKSADPLLDPIVVETLSRWRFHPYAINGRPVPFCTNYRYEIRRDPPPPSGAADAPKFVPPNAATRLLDIDPMDDRYRAKLPPELATPGALYWAMVKICASPKGDVTEVKLIKSAHADVDPRIVEAMSRWRFKPLMVDGKAVPFCSNYRYQIATR
jgi:hypothetical protein